ncbi:MAG: hypothetical protein LBV72_10535 [Tannerella sp.]|jgi:hypothetical protein|nr:hypothetical protein [Tannerella sp.]
MKKKPFVILVQLLFAGVLFFSCNNESDTINYRLPISSELPLCSYSLSDIDTTNKEAILEILRNREAIVIQSEADLENCLSEIENLYDKGFRKKYPEYTSVDFSKYTLLLSNFIQSFDPEDCIEMNSYFYTSEYAARNSYLLEEYENYDYYYIRHHSYYGNEWNEIPVFVYVSGIVVDKIPEGGKVRSLVNYSVSSRKD